MTVIKTLSLLKTCPSTLCLAMLGREYTMLLSGHSLSVGLGQQVALEEDCKAGEQAPFSRLLSPIRAQSPTWVRSSNTFLIKFLMQTWNTLPNNYRASIFLKHTHSHILCLCVSIKYVYIILSIHLSTSQALKRTPTNSKQSITFRKSFLLP